MGQGQIALVVAFFSTVTGQRVPRHGVQGAEKNQLKRFSDVGDDVRSRRDICEQDDMWMCFVISKLACR